MVYFKHILAFFFIFILSSPIHARDIYDLERIINRALEANWGMIDARDDIRRSRLWLASAESEFELKVYPGAGIGFSGGDDQSSETDLNLQINLEKKTEFGTVIGLTPSVQRADDQYRNSTSLSISQPLLRGVGRDYNLSGVYSARYTERSSRRSGHLKKVNTVLGAVRYGYEVVRQRELVRLRRESHQRLSDLAEATAIKKKMGLVTAMDLYRASIQMNQAEEELITSQESFYDALDSLKIFLALPVEKEIDVSLPLNDDRIHPDEKEMIENALNNRIEMEQMQDSISEARRNSEIARKNTLPDLDLVFSVTQSGDSSSGFPGSGPNNTAWGISLASSTDLWRTSEKAAYEESLIDVQQAARNQIITRDDITAQVKRELRSLERLDKAILSQDEQIQQAKGQLELSRVKFQHGMADNFDLIDAETSLRRAQTQMISAIIDYIIGKYRLRAAIGTLVER